MKKTLYIAYGSNLNKEQMQYRCPDSEFVGTGQLRSYKLQFRRVLTVVPCPGSSVPVAVWKISPSDEAHLDVYEGFPCAYSKQRLHIDFSDGTGCSAMAYIMNGGYLVPPSISYFDIVVRGFRDCNFDEGVLQKALKESQSKIARLERRR